MTSSRAIRRFAFTFSTSFAVLYAIALRWDLALFTIYPTLGIVLFGTHHSRDVADPSLSFIAPAMYWYGWTATAALGAFIIACLAVLFPEERWTQRIWLEWLWVAPVTAMAACVYFTLPWFRL